jgi:5-methylcytosine-specific restriction protein A
VSDRRYGTARWRRIRAMHLAKEPLCRMCLERGRFVSARIADHIIPHRGDDRLFWRGKLQSLCETHHNSTKHREEIGSARSKIGVDGWPAESREAADSDKG